MTGLYRFDDVQIDLPGFRLLKDGQALPVEPKALNLLIFLVQNGGRLIGRRELIDAVWGDAFVTDQVLNRAVGQLRKLLHDDSKQPRYIETVPTLGYRFIADVAVEEVQAPATSSRAAMPGKPMVEPAASAGAQPDGATVEAAAGVSAATSSRTTKLSAVLLALAALIIVGVIALWMKERASRSSNVAASIRSLAVLPLDNLLGDPSQQYLVDGMTVELITGLAQIRALRVISQTTAMQYKDAHKPLPQIAKELNVDAVIEGSVMRSNDQIRISAQLVDAPDDIEAGGAISGADAAIAKALELEPELGAAYEERAWTLYKFRWDFQSAEAGFRRALELEPGAPSAHDGLAHALMVQGRFDDALGEIKSAKERDPLSLIVNTDYCQILRFARQYDRALTVCEATLKLAPDYSFALFITGELDESKGDYEEAHKLWLKQGCDAPCSAAIDEIYGAPGVAGAFDAWLKRQKHPQEAFFPARAYAGLHRKDQAFAWLEKAYELHSEVSAMAFLGIEPDFDSLRSDPRFDAFLRHVGLPPQPHLPATRNT